MAVIGHTISSDFDVVQNNDTSRDSVSRIVEISDLPSDARLVAGVYKGRYGNVTVEIVNDETKVYYIQTKAYFHNSPSSATDGTDEIIENADTVNISARLANGKSLTIPVYVDIEDSKPSISIESISGNYNSGITGQVSIVPNADEIKTISVNINGNVAVGVLDNSSNYIFNFGDYRILTLEPSGRFRYVNSSGVDDQEEYKITFSITDKDGDTTTVSVLDMSRSSKKDIPVELLKPVQNLDYGLIYTEETNYDRIYDLVTDLIDSLSYDIDTGAIEGVCQDTRDLTPRIDDKLIERLLPNYEDVEAVNAFYRLFIQPIVGTKTAVSSIFKAVGDVGQVKEWFDHSLTPYHFAIEYERIPEEIDIDRIIELADWLKNERSHLITIRTPLCGYAFKWEASRWDKDFWDNIEGQKWKDTNVYVCFSVKDSGYDFFKFDPLQMTTFYYGYNLGYIHNSYHDWDQFTWDNFRKGEFVRQITTFMFSNATYLSRPAVTYPKFDKVNGIWLPRTFLQNYDFIERSLKLKKLPAINHDFFISPNCNQEILYSPEILRIMYTHDYIEKISINASWTRDECYDEWELVEVKEIVDPSSVLEDRLNFEWDQVKIDNTLWDAEFKDSYDYTTVTKYVKVRKHRKVWNSDGGKPLELDIKPWDSSNWDYQTLNRIRDRLLLTAINNVYLLSSLHLSLDSRNWDKKEPYSIYRDSFTKVEPRLSNEALTYQTSHVFRKDPLQKVYKSKYKVFHGDSENDPEAEVILYHNSFQWDNSISDNTLWDNQVIDVIVKDNTLELELNGIESFVWDISSAPDNVLFDSEDLYEVGYEIERILKEPILPNVIIKKFGDLVFNERLWYLLNEDVDYDVSYKAEFTFDYARLNLRRGKSFELASYLGFVDDVEFLHEGSGTGNDILFQYKAPYPLTVTTPFNIQCKARLSSYIKSLCEDSSSDEICSISDKDFPREEWFDFVKSSRYHSNDFCGKKECGIIRCGMPALLTNINQEILKYSNLDDMPYPAFERTMYTHFYSMYNKARYSLGLGVRNKFNCPDVYVDENHNGLGRNVYDKWLFESEYRARTGEAYCGEDLLGLTISNTLLRDLYTWSNDVDSSFSIYIRTVYADCHPSIGGYLDKPILSEGTYPKRNITHVGDSLIEYLPDPYSPFYKNDDLDIEKDLSDWVDYTESNGYEIDISVDTSLSSFTDHIYGSNWDAFLYERNNSSDYPRYSLYDFDIQGIKQNRKDIFVTDTLTRGNNNKLISHTINTLDNIYHYSVQTEFEVHTINTLDFQCFKSESDTLMVHTGNVIDNLIYEDLFYLPLTVNTLGSVIYKEISTNVYAVNILDNLSVVDSVPSVFSQEALDLAEYQNLVPRIYEFIMGIYSISEFPGWIRGGEIDIDDPAYSNMDIDNWEQDPDRVTNVPPPIIYQNIHVDVNEQTIFVGEERYSVYKVYGSELQVALYSSMAEARIESPYDIDVDGYFTEVDIDDPRFADVDIDSFTYDVEAVERRNSGYSIDVDRSPEVWNIDIRNIIIDDIDAMGDATVDDINLADIDSDSIKVKGKDINLNLYKGLSSENFEEMGAINYDIDIEQDIDVDALDIEDIDTFQPDIDLDTLLADFDIDSKYIDVDANASYLIVVDTVYNSVYQYEGMKSFSTSVYQNIRYIQTRLAA